MFKPEGIDRSATVWDTYRMEKRTPRVVGGITYYPVFNQAGKLIWVTIPE
jgi:hypothetical protein